VKATRAFAISVAASLIGWPLTAAVAQEVAPPATGVTADNQTIAELRRGLAGEWTGSLDYRDYTANEWFGIPMTVRIEAVGDGVTLIRHARYDDGPVTGMVDITTVQLFDPASGNESQGIFRRGRTSELLNYRLSLGGTPADATHWTIIFTSTAMDDNRPATLRETMTRDGDRVTTVKEVDFLDDTGENWLARNRTVLTRTAS
jgi:hypothetical protein